MFLFAAVLEKGSWKPQKPAFDFLRMIDEEDRKKLHQRRHKERVENFVPPGVGEGETSCINLYDFRHILF